MNRCPNEKQLNDYFEGSLPRERKRAIDKHIAGCPSCQYLLKDLENVDSLLRARKRPEPAKSLHKQYVAQLNSLFPVVHSGPWKKGLAVLSRLFGYSPQRNLVRFAYGLILVLFGFFIGRYGMIQQRDRAEQGKTANLVLVSISSADREIFQDYLTRSEIWLLSMGNTTVQDRKLVRDFSLDRETAVYLLGQMPFLEQKAYTIQDSSLIRFLNGIEPLLLETSNTKHSEVGLISDIQKIISNKQLIDENRRLQLRFQNRGI